MDWSKLPYLEPVLGDTWCIVTPFSRIPFYKLNRKEIVLMDSGLPDRGRGGVVELLEKQGLRVQAVLTSHVHIDHTGNHRTLQKLHGARLYMTPFAAAVSEDPLAMKLYLGGDSYIGTDDYARPLYCSADELLRPERGNISIEGAQFQLVPLPGHAPAHLGFITPDGVAYLADTLLSEQAMHSIRIPFCGCCQADLDSKHRAAELNCAGYVLAHNQTCDDVGDIVRRNVKFLQEKIDVVAAAADHYMTMEELTLAASRAMGMHSTTRWKIFTAMNNTRSYAEYLLDQGCLFSRICEGRVEYIRAELA